MGSTTFQIPLNFPGLTPEMIDSSKAAFEKQFGPCKLLVFGTVVLGNGIGKEATVQSVVGVEVEYVGSYSMEVQLEGRQRLVLLPSCNSELYDDIPRVGKLVFTTQ